MAAELDTSVSNLLGETMPEQKPEDLKVLSEKLEVINLQLAKRERARAKTIRWALIALCAGIVLLYQRHHDGTVGLKQGRAKSASRSLDRGQSPEHEPVVIPDIRERPPARKDTIVLSIGLPCRWPFLFFADITNTYSQPEVQGPRIQIR